MAVSSHNVQDLENDCSFPLDHMARDSHNDSGLGHSIHEDQSTPFSAKTKGDHLSTTKNENSTHNTKNGDRAAERPPRGPNRRLRMMDKVPPASSAQEPPMDAENLLPFTHRFQYNPCSSAFMPFRKFATADGESSSPLKKRLSHVHESSPLKKCLSHVGESSPFKKRRTHVHESYLMKKALVESSPLKNSFHVSDSSPVKKCLTHEHESSPLKKRLAHVHESYPMKKALGESSPLKKSVHVGESCPLKKRLTHAHESSPVKKPLGESSPLNKHLTHVPELYPMKRTPGESPPLKKSVHVGELSPLKKCISHVHESYSMKKALGESSPLKKALGESSPLKKYLSHRHESSPRKPLIHVGELSPLKKPLSESTPWMKSFAYADASSPRKALAHAGKSSPLKKLFCDTSPKKKVPTQKASGHVGDPSPRKAPLAQLDMNSPSKRHLEVKDSPQQAVSSKPGENENGRKRSFLIKDILQSECSPTRDGSQANVSHPTKMAVPNTDCSLHSGAAQRRNGLDADRSSLEDPTALIKKRPFDAALSSTGDEYRPRDMSSLCEKRRSDDEEAMDLRTFPSTSRSVHLVSVERSSVEPNDVSKHVSSSPFLMRRPSSISFNQMYSSPLYPLLPCISSSFPNWDISSPGPYSGFQTISSEPSPAPHLMVGQHRPVLPPSARTQALSQPLTSAERASSSTVTSQQHAQETDSELREKPQQKQQQHSLPPPPQPLSQSSTPSDFRRTQCSPTMTSQQQVLLGAALDELHQHWTQQPTLSEQQGRESYQQNAASQQEQHHNARQSQQQSAIPSQSRSAKKRGSNEGKNDLMTPEDAWNRMQLIISLVLRHKKTTIQLKVHPSMEELLKRVPEGQMVKIINDGMAIKDPFWKDPAADIKCVKASPQDGATEFYLHGQKLEQEDRRSANRHIRRKKDKAPYLCIFCFERSGDATDMARHCRTHTQINPFVCDVCGEAFKQNVSLENHKDNKHGLKKPDKHSSRQKIYVNEITGETFTNAADFHANAKQLFSWSRTAQTPWDGRIFRQQRKTADGLGGDGEDE